MLLGWNKDNENTINFVYGHKSYTVRQQHRLYNDIFNSLKTQDKDKKLGNLAERLSDKFISIQETIKDNKIDNVLEFVNGVVYFKGEKVHGYIAERLVEFYEADAPLTNLINFLDKLQQNPSYSAVEELYDFLVHKNFPICEDGDFLAYKKVTEDYLDYYTRKVDNSIGKSVFMPRNRVDDNRSVGCSRGYHAGTLNYAQTFHSNQGRIIIVKINPKHVVSVPTDCDCQKLRTEGYLCFKDFESKLDYVAADNRGKKLDKINLNF